MEQLNPRSTASIAGHPIHPMLVPIPITCFIGVLVVDIVFLTGGDAGWATASLWLLGAGLVGALAAATAGLADYMGDERIRKLSHALQHMIANISVVVLEAVNLALRLQDRAAIEHIGVYLSAIAVAILGYSGWLGGNLVFHHRVGVQNAETGAIDRQP